MSASDWNSLSLTQRVTVLWEREPDQKTFQTLQLDPQRIVTFWADRVSKEQIERLRNSREPDPTEIEMKNRVKVIGNWDHTDAFVSELARHKILLEPEHLCLINLKMCDTLEEQPGEYRKIELYTGLSMLDTLIPYKDVPKEMEKFFSWLQERLKNREHNPVYLASRACERLLAISPFPDGNHRTAKAVMDYILQLNGLPPARLFRPIPRLVGNKNIYHNPSPEYICTLIRNGVETSHKVLGLPSPFLNVEN